MASAEDLNIYPRYALVGKQPLGEYVRFKIDRHYNGEWRKNPNEVYQDFSNTCALRVSYALNYGGIPIKDLCYLPSGALKGEDGHLYYTGVPRIKELLKNNWNKGKRIKPFSERINYKEFYKVFYDKKEEYLNIINDPKLLQKVRKANQDFFDTLKSLNQNGIVTMDIDGWGNAGGHTTFFNKESKGFLDDTNYLNDRKMHIFVRELCFWKI
ncbi:hypothetical protein LS70_009245 [Helicobacter sp. MIT 11-5569]|uniref:T6SS effector amidase Tae4 family protein n=1 Tax=Helicobacter sp. MIT 11-5569 TaxID=1548151 RepID=UPI0009E0108D|nr:T6SS effector amidase Tae4 family protein [Helicobacter sp. MIT 11-5569]TLD80355.1 hypothetical protein LS70_009245 [Helicobacter sp. MIT 11-5569]